MTRTKKRSTKKRSASKRGTKKRDTKKRDTKKRSASKRGTRKGYQAPKRRPMPNYQRETMLILKTSLKTDVRLRSLVKASLAKESAAPSWAGKSIGQFIAFFRQWMVAPIDIMDPGNNISQFSILIQNTVGYRVPRVCTTKPVRT